MLLFATLALPFTIRGKGNVSCGKWTQVRQGAVRYDTGSQADVLIYTAWIPGGILQLKTINFGHPVMWPLAQTFWEYKNG
jgi:hypothetical protein